MDVLFMGILFLLTGNIVIASIFDIHSSYGKIIINPPVNCTLMLNDTEVSILNGKVPGLHYGLIEYECGIYKGIIISKPECFECGLYCPQNDRLLNCQHFALPYSLGIITAFSISMIIAIIMHKYGFGLISKMVNNLKDKRRLHKEKKYHKYISRYNNIIDKESIAINGSSKNIVEITNNDNRAQTNHKRYPSLTEIAVGTLLLTSDRTFACDRTLFMHSNGQICDKQKCQEINSYNFNIGLGKTICFNTPSKDMMKFQIVNTKNIINYQQLYYTSDYEIDLESTSNCKQQGLCFKETCYKGYKHPDFDNKTGVHGFDCDTEGLGCDFLCWHKYACTWYSWWFKEVGFRASVYKRVSTIWSFDLIVTYRGVMKSYNFNSDVTQYDLDIGKLFSSDNMPININNVIKSNYFSHDYIIKDMFSFYEVTANDLNQLTPGKIGDYQISIDNKERIYKINEIHCKTSGCNVRCNGPEPSLRLFRSLKHRKVVKEYNMIDENTISTMTMIPMTVSLNIGNVEFKNLFVEQASCDFNVLETFGCIGCNSMPYAVIKAYKIVNHGSLPFISNCTFNIKNLYCSDSIFKIIPVQKYNSCNLFIPSINKSLDIGFKYEFFGELTIPESIYSQDLGFKGILTSLSNNPNYIDTLTYGLFAFTGLGLILSILSKLTMRVLILRQAQKIKEDTEMNRL